jgi:hypothetical protein
MRPPLPTAPNPDNFSNVDWPGATPEPTHPLGNPKVSLRRVVEGDREEFELLTRIRYDDEVLDTAIVVPTDGTFTTDLVSVPRIFTWLVPKSGSHLPAALVHDGLIGGNHHDYETVPAGRHVDRIDADRVFRDAMRDTRVGRIRRWLVWAAVSTASLCLGGRDAWRWWHRAWYVLVTVLTLGTVGVLGTAATLDLVDGRLGTWFDVPWMHGPWWLEIAQGLSGAVVVPLAVAVIWGRYYRVGAVVGVALATLLHVTVAVALVALGYQVAEWLVRSGWAWSVAIVGAVVGAAVVFLMALV